MLPARHIVGKGSLKLRCVRYHEDERQNLVLEFSSALPAGAEVNLKKKFPAAKVEKAVRAVLVEVERNKIPLGSVKHGEIQIVGVRSIVANRFYLDVEYEVLFPGKGKPDSRGVYHTCRWIAGIENGSIAVPITKEKCVVFSRQYRHGPRGWRLTLPQGLRKDGETFVACAEREAREEAGMVCVGTPCITELGQIEEDLGFAMAKPFVFAFTNIEVDKSKVRADISESETGYVLVPIANIRPLIKSGQLVEGTSIAALYKAEIAGLFGS